MVKLDGEKQVRLPCRALRAQKGDFCQVLAALDCNNKRSVTAAIHIAMVRVNLKQLSTTIQYVHH